MVNILSFLLAGALWGAGVRVEFDPRDPAIGPFPTNFLTETDGSQRTFRRVNLPLGDCAGRSSDCGELRMINQLDGFSPNARATVKFSGAINPDTLKAGVFYVWLDQIQSGRVPLKPEGRLTPMNQLIYDPSSNTAYGKPDEILEGTRRYALIVTDAVRDRAGDPVEIDPGFRLCLDGRVGASYCTEVAAALTRAQPLVNPRRIVAASVFTTLSTTAWYEQTAAIVNRVFPDFRRQREIVSLTGLRSVTHRQQVGTRGDNRFEDVTLPVPAALLQQFGVGRVAFGWFRSPRFIAPNQMIPTMPTSGELPMPPQTDEISFHVWLPARPAPPGGYPVILAGHGITDNRFGMPTVIAAAASVGYAVVAMPAVGHGFGPESSVRLDFGASVMEVPAPGRGIDLTGDGRIDSAEGCIFLVPGAPLGGRDCLRQTAVDYMQLVHAIRDGMDLDGDGQADLNPGAISYYGMSLGSFYGAIASSMTPEISAAVLNVGGGYLSEAARLSPNFRPVFLVGPLATREPRLLNTPTGLDEDLPLRNEPVRIRTVAGAAAIQEMLERVEWLESLGAAAPVAAHLKQSPLPGFTPRRVLFQIAFGDMTVPNPANSSLVRAAGLREQTSLYRFDKAKAVATDLPANPHSFLLPIGPNSQALISLAALQQGFQFLASGTEQVPDVNSLVRAAFGTDLFEIPAEPPERTNFVR